MDKNQKINSIKDLLLIVFGIVSATIGLKMFLIPNNFLDGGVTGVSLLSARIFGTDVALFIFIINIPFVVLAYRHISGTFAFVSLASVSILAVLVHYIELPVVTNDKLLISFFGGLFLGAGIGFSVRGGAVIDGTEILAVYLGKKIRTTIGTVILIFNILLFSVAAMLIDPETALYSILTYITASKTADYIIHGIEEYIGVTIISGRSDEIRRAVTEQLGYGATVYLGRRGYRTKAGDDDTIEILHTVTTRLEIGKLRRLIQKIDSAAFVVEYNINDTRGGIVKRSRNRH